MIVDRSVTRSSGEGSPLTLGDVLECSGVAVSLGEAKVDTVDEVSVSPSRIGDKVGRFDISVDEMARVHEFHAL